MAESAIALSVVNGKRFGRLTALDFVNMERGVGLAANFRNWHFRCDCGKTLTAPLFKVKRGALTSCGCADRDEADRLFAVPGKPHLRIKPVILRPELALMSYQHGVASTERSVIGAWVNEGMFTPDEVFAIEEAKMLWNLIARPSHDLFEPDDPENRREGLLAERAKALLRNCRVLVGWRDWAIFENVVRWNEPLGFIGSRMMDGTESNGSARATVTRVAKEITEAGILDETGLSNLLGE